MDPTTAAGWITILREIGLPGFAVLAACYGVWRAGGWLANAATGIAEWSGPLVVRLVEALSTHVSTINLRLAAIEEKIEHTGRGVRDLHRRLDGTCPAEDSDDGEKPAPSSKSHILRQQPRQA